MPDSSFFHLEPADRPLRVVFDLDGTLADDTHRKHLLETEPRAWEDYFALCGDDAPIRTSIALFRLLRSTPALCSSVAIWTARSAKVQNETLDWIREHVWPEPVELKMRPAHCRMDDTQLKRRWLDAAREAGTAPDLVFEDRNRVVDMWREEGVACHQVAPGDF